MSQLTTTAPVDPMVQLVDFDGTPISAPAPRPAGESWPAWTDLVRVRCGATDDEMERHRLSVGIGDTLSGILWRAEQPGKDDDQADGFDADLERFEASHPVRSPLATAFPITLGTMPLPIRGGASSPDRTLDVPTLEAVATALYGTDLTSAV
jgi:hypothetical protein